MRQLGFALALVAGIFVSQWPVAFSSANAVTGLPVSAAGGRRPHLGCRSCRSGFAFAGGMLSSC